MNMNISALERVLTELDHARLFNLAHERERAASHDAEGFAALLDQATLVDSRRIAPDVVTMRSRFVLRELHDGSVRTVTLCYPVDADPTQGRLSVMSPLGMALIGLPLGAHATWHCPNGEVRSAVVEEIVYQPEASGDYLA